MHCISLRAGERLRRLSEHFELVWASGWEDKANYYLPKLLGLPELPHVSFETDARFGIAHWKLGPSRPTAGGGRSPGSTTTSTRAATRGRGRARRRRCWSRPSRTCGLEEARRLEARSHCRGTRGLQPILTKSPAVLLDCKWVTGFWPIFFLLVVLKIPVLGSLWLVWWASSTRTRARGGRGQRRRPKRRRAATAAAARAAPRAARRRRGGAAARLPARSGRTRVVRPAAQPAFARAGSRAGRDGSRPRRYDA